MKRFFIFLLLLPSLGSCAVEHGYYDYYDMSRDPNVFLVEPHRHSHYHRHIEMQSPQVYSHYHYHQLRESSRFRIR